MTCTNCKKNAPFTTPADYVVKDFNPIHQEKVFEDSKGNRTNNAKNPLNFNKSGSLCQDCLKALGRNGFLEINKIKE